MSTAGAPDLMQPLVPGEAHQLTPLIRRVLARNPSHMTGPGTSTFLIGNREVAVIDPGPDEPEHLEAIVAAAGGAPIRWILITHTHYDHIEGLESFKARTGAEVLGFGNDDGLVVDRALADGDTLTTPEFTLRAVHTPGHVGDHLSYLLEDESVLFAGDHMMQGSSPVIIPPHGGDVAAFLHSLQRLLTMTPPIRTILPAHGLPFTDPPKAIGTLIQHRHEREARVLESLEAATGPSTIDDLMPLSYPTVSDVLRPVARASLWAHLIKLADEGRVRSSLHDDPALTTWELRR